MNRMTPAVFMSVLVLASCNTVHLSDNITSYYYPGAAYLGEEESYPMQNLLELYSSKDDLEQWLLKKCGPEITETTLADPFITNTHLTATIATTDPGQMIAQYYENIFQHNGWQLQRDRLPIEESNMMGRDWGRVYRRGEQLVSVHVSGHWDRRSEQESTVLGSRVITLGFLGTTPETILGKGYRKKTQSNHGLESTGAPPAAGTPETHP